MALVDGAWALYFRTVASGNIPAASFWSGVIVLIGGYVIVSYTHDRRLLLAAVLGAAAGTAATMAVTA